MLQVDLTRTIRSNADKVDLVRAIRDAPLGEPETDWVEWKIELDIVPAEGAFKAARTILGFGNRDPNAAQQWLKGTAYFVVGVEPGEIRGVTTVVDTADIEQSLARYIDRGEPQWSADYVEVDGDTVLVITVEAPENGDDICTLRKEYGGFEAGAILVRSGSRTARATPSDVRRLTARASEREARIGVGVSLQSDEPIPTIVDLRPGDEAFVAQAKEWAHKNQPYRPPSVHTRIVDTRSSSAYRAEVEKYLEGVPGLWTLVVHRACFDAGLCDVVLEITNPGELNYRETQVTLTFDSSVEVYADSVWLSNEIKSRDQRPDDWGTHGIHRLGMVPRSRPEPPIPPPWPKIEYTSSAAQVTFEPVDVRPHTDHPLPALTLLVPEALKGTDLEIAWRATSTGALGDSKGLLMVPVSEQVLSFETPEPDDGE